MLICHLRFFVKKFLLILNLWESKNQSYKCLLISTVQRLNFVPVNAGKLSGKTFIRTATNVGPLNSVYTARVESPKGVTVTVKPPKLVFSEEVRKLMYAVTVTVDTKNLVLDDSGAVYGSLSWLDGKHVVRSPIVVTQISPL